MLIEPTLRQNLAVLVSIFTEAAAISTSHIGVQSVNDARVLVRIADGAGFTAATYDRVVAWLSGNWPDGIDWPPEIGRPTPDECLSVVKRRKSAA